MGADIHCYIEHGRRPKGDEKIFWSSFNYSGLNPGRNYDVFGAIAGVRRSDNQMVELRGMPADAGYGARSSNQLYVVDDDDPSAAHESFCSRSDAESFVNSGWGSKWVNAEKTIVTHPDWHSHTWLTPAEWRQVIEAEYEYGPDDEYFAIAALMEELERRGNEVRIIIWFDS